MALCAVLREGFLFGGYGFTFACHFLTGLFETFDDREVITLGFEIGTIFLQTLDEQLGLLDGITVNLVHNDDLEFLKMVAVNV